MENRIWSPSSTSAQRSSNSLYRHCHAERNGNCPNAPKLSRSCIFSDWLQERFDGRNSRWNHAIEDPVSQVNRQCEWIIPAMACRRLALKFSERRSYTGLVKPQECIQALRQGMSLAGSRGRLVFTLQGTMKRDMFGVERGSHWGRRKSL